MTPRLAAAVIAMKTVAGIDNFNGNDALDRARECQRKRPSARTNFQDRVVLRDFRKLDNTVEDRPIRQEVLSEAFLQGRRT